MHPALRGLGWQRRAAALMRRQLDAIFPATASTRATRSATSSIGRRQMVEIARAFTVTDTPAAAGDPRRADLVARRVLAEQLLAFVRRFVASGGSVVLISHLLGEILATADRIVVMRDGQVVALDAAAAFDRDVAGRAPWAASARAARGGTAVAARAERPADGACPAARPGRGGRARRPPRRDRRPRRAQRPRPDRVAVQVFGRADGAEVAGAGGAGRRRPADRRRSSRSGRSPRTSASARSRRFLAGLLLDPRARARLRRGLAGAHRHPHARHRQPDPVAVRRQPAEGAVRPRARLRCRDRRSWTTRCAASTSAPSRRSTR